MLPDIIADEQEQLDRLLRAHSRKRLNPDPSRQLFIVIGAGGTGKTTARIEAANRIDALCLSQTGKGADSLRKRGARRVSTIHALLYGAPRRGKGGSLIWRLRDAEPIPAVFVDEGSLADATLWRHLLSRVDKIATAFDPYQLSSGLPFIQNRPADFELKQVRRQDADSPILKMATDLRTGGRTPQGVWFDKKLLLGADIVIAALRKTCHNQNKMIRRERFGLKPDHLPIPGETLICIRTDYDAGVFRGSMWTVREVVEVGQLLRLTLFDPIEGERVVLTPKICFEFEHAPEPETLPPDLTAMGYGYCITAHTAQGSEWLHVSVLDETGSHSQFEWLANQARVPVAEYKRRWLYTAITRASQHLDTIDL